MNAISCSDICIQNLIKNTYFPKMSLPECIKISMVITPLDLNDTLVDDLYL